MNMKNGGRRNVRTNREIKGSDEYTTLDTSLKFGSLDKTRIKSSDPKDNLGGSGKGLITSMGLKAKECLKEIQKVKVCHSEMSVLRKFQRLSGILKNCFLNVMRGGGPNIIPLAVTFTHQDSLQSV